MSAPNQSAAEMLPRLEQVRRVCLEDPNQYSSVVTGVVPILQGQHAVEVRRWGAEFIAEVFATPALPGQQKEQMISDMVMTLLRRMLDTPNEDTTVVKTAIQACASIYPYMFRKVIAQPDLSLFWHDMTAIKQNILQRMDVAPMPIRIASIKFLQKVVQVQTPGLIADPRRSEHNETSISLVPRNHPLLPLPNLEAETSGILDRLLTVIQDNSIDPLLVDATMNSLAVLIKTRPAIQTKILLTVLNYNPLRAAGGPMTARQIVVIKSLQRTTRALLRFVMRIMPQHPLAEKIDLYLRRLQSNTVNVFTQAQSLKRPADSVDEIDAVKRQKLEPVRRFPSMASPPVSYAQLYTLIDNPDFQQFDVKILREDIVSMISSMLMQHVDSKSLDEAIAEVQQRYQTLQEAARKSAGITAEDDDDYDPEALSSSDNMVSGGPQSLEDVLPQPALELGPVELPKPEPLNETELNMLTMQTVAHVFETALSSEQNSSVLRQKLGINRLAGSSNDKDSWLTLFTRLATRAPAGLHSLIESEVDLDDQPIETGPSPDHPNAANLIRRQLFDYVLDDWKHRLSLGLTWLTEEWYADKIQVIGTANGDAPTTKTDSRTPHYDYWTRELFQTLIPRFDKDDHRILIRFLSELPSLNHNILSIVRPLTRDPATVDICKKALQYLYLMRPPVRELVVDTIEDIWREGDDDVKSTMGPLLQKWRPGFLEQAVEETKKEIEDTRTFPNGVKGEDSVVATT
ncbi:hypothetical protein LTR05_002124 [Lithohypha guttulata]|uniref:Symplekin/Pta1 N-terminal domain-containing protein n=1 Tax=Lithohypha guttulata TaxID=1690604 RepID=A0AAN7T2Z3_9EURO|nr:hypothetical protein LTR05_002124 [Lithohypha guttulata]